MPERKESWVVIHHEEMPSYFLKISLITKGECQGAYRTLLGIKQKQGGHYNNKFKLYGYSGEEPVVQWIIKRMLLNPFTQHAGKRKPYVINALLDLAVKHDIDFKTPVLIGQPYVTPSILVEYHRRDCVGYLLPHQSTPRYTTLDQLDLTLTRSRDV